MSDEAPRAKGKALPRSDDDLDRLSRIDDAARDEAAAWWRRDAPRKDRGMLDAKAEDGRGTQPNGA